MKKLLLPLTLLMSLAGTARAQSANFGLKAGVSLTGFTGADAGNSAYKFGFNGGVMANFAFNDMLSIQPEVLYSLKGAKPTSAANSSDDRINLGYIDVPVLVQIATGKTGLFFEAGPQIGFLTSARYKFNSVDVDYKDYTNSVDFGYAAGLGFKAASGPLIGLRYNGGFTRVGKDATIGSLRLQANETHNSAFQLYVGFLFGGK